MGMAMNAQTGTALDTKAAAEVKFSVAVVAPEKTARATVSFKADGFQPLPDGGWVAVNGAPMAVAPLAKQGHWYKGELPAAMSYELSYALGANQPVVRKTLAARAFAVALPTEVSRGGALVLAFQGPPLRANERLFAELTGGGDGPGRWGTTLKSTLSQNVISISAESLRAARLGPAQLYVGVLTRESSAGGYSATHAIGAEQAVRIVD